MLIIAPAFKSIFILSQSRASQQGGQQSLASPAMEGAIGAGDRAQGHSDYYSYKYLGGVGSFQAPGPPGGTYKAGGIRSVLTLVYGGVLRA